MSDLADLQMHRSMRQRIKHYLDPGSALYFD